MTPVMTPVVSARGQATTPTVSPTKAKSGYNLFVQDFLTGLSESEKASYVQQYGKSFHMKAAAAVWKTLSGGERAEWNRKSAQMNQL